MQFVVNVQVSLKKTEKKNRYANLNSIVIIIFKGDT